MKKFSKQMLKELNSFNKKVTYVENKNAIIELEKYGIEVKGGEKYAKTY